MATRIFELDNEVHIHGKNVSLPFPRGIFRVRRSSIESDSVDANDKCDDFAQFDCAILVPKGNASSARFDHGNPALNRAAEFVGLLEKVHPRRGRMDRLPVIRLAGTSRVPRSLAAPS
jgi:hypothetical protein